MASIRTVKGSETKSKPIKPAFMMPTKPMTAPKMPNVMQQAKMPKMSGPKQGKMGKSNAR